MSQPIVSLGPLLLAEPDAPSYLMLGERRGDA